MFLKFEMRSRMRAAALICALVLEFGGAQASSDFIGLHKMTKTIWSNTGGNLSTSTEAVNALDAILLVLNSKNLNKRQVPVTCPYCPPMFPCSPGCPPAPALDIPGIAGPPGPAGPPGQPGPPGVPVYGPGTRGCPGHPGPPGACIRGSPGAPGLDGQPGTCHTRDPSSLTFDPAVVRALVQQNLVCPATLRCQYSVDTLLVRIHRLESQLVALDSVKQTLASLTQHLAALRGQYSDKEKHGAPGPQGIPGEAGESGMPGYNGRQGRCLVSPLQIPSRPGYPGPPGPKGDPGLPGDKACVCRGDVGDPGLVGTSLRSQQGEKGYKGIKGVKGLPACTHRVGVEVDPQPVPCHGLYLG